MFKNIQLVLETMLRDVELYNTRRVLEICGNVPSKILAVIDTKEDTKVQKFIVQKWENQIKYRFYLSSKYCKCFKMY